MQPPGSVSADDIPLYGGVEAGGTKFVCALGRGPADVHATTRIDTTTPGDTLRRVADFFRAQPAPPAAIGIGSFGPIDADPASPTYGHITSTPKKGWADTDIAGRIGDALGVPVAFGMDVGMAARGEQQWGAARDVRRVLYLTVGTGVGGAFLSDGEPLRGQAPPEMGHIAVPRASGDAFEGVCPFHGDCLEGLASGPALAARWDQLPPTLPADHPAWTMQTHYLAAALTTFICILVPGRVIVGGGVMQQQHLFPRLRERVQARLGGYLRDVPAGSLDDYIVPPGLGERSGVLGAIAAAQQLARATPQDAEA